MAENSGDVSTAMVIGIGIVLFMAVVGVWYLFLRTHG
jgi:hypothetical protein